jgi:hypothetical protein
LYQTNRQADAEAIVRILREIEPEMRENPLQDGECILCFNPISKHGESCPFRLSDEFIAKYGTQPPTEPRRA